MLSDRGYAIHADLVKVIGWFWSQQIPRWIGDFTSSDKNENKKNLRSVYSLLKVSDCAGIVLAIPDVIATAWQQLPAHAASITAEVNAPPQTCHHTSVFTLMAHWCRSFLRECRTWIWFWVQESGGSLQECVLSYLTPFFLLNLLSWQHSNALSWNKTHCGQSVTKIC